MLATRAWPISAIRANGIDLRCVALCATSRQLPVVVRLNLVGRQFALLASIFLADADGRRQFEPLCTIDTFYTPSRPMLRSYYDMHVLYSYI